MLIFKKWSALGACAILCLCLGACGGGGSSSAAPSVTLNVTGPSSISAVLYEGELAPNPVISGRLSGDLSALSGKTLYLFATVPEPLFSPYPAVHVDSDGQGGNLQLLGVKVPDGPKTYSNVITIRACLDAECKVEIPVKNSQVPYSIKVKKGLAVSSEDVSLHTAFGTPASPVELTVTLPEDVISWGVTPVSGQYFDMIRAEKSQTQPTTIVVSAIGQAAASSTYNTMALVEANTSDGHRLVKLVAMSLITDPSSVPYALENAKVEFVVKQGTPSLSERRLNSIILADNSRDKVHLIDKTFTWPVEADSNAYRDRWLYQYLPDEISSPRTPGPRYWSEVQVQACYDGNCLPPGRYMSVIHYRYLPDGRPAEDIYAQVIMDIVP